MSDSRAPLPPDLDWGSAERRAVVIVGTGPAGLTAALYAARAGLEPLVIQGPAPGGQLTTTTDVENFPGYPDGVMGPDMMADLEKQATRFGTELRWGTVTHVDFSDLEGGHRLVVDEATPVVALSVIVATGASAKYLGLENEKRLLGRGVSACATCDGAFFREEEIAIVGGGDTAMEEALFLTRFASTVHLIHRRDEFRASQIMQDRVLGNPKVRVHWNTVVTDVKGQDAVTALALEDAQTGETRDLEVTGFFVAIGHKPNTEIFAGWLPMDDAGYIETHPDSTWTDVPGVFVCGDAQDHVYRQAVTAAGTGCMAAIDAERWLAEQDVIEEPRTETEYHAARADDFGGDRTDRAVSAELGISTPEAGLLRSRLADANRRTAWQLDPPPEPDAAARRVIAAVDAVTDAAAVWLASELSAVPESPVTRLAFVGGGANDAGVCRRVAGRLKLGAQYGDLMTRLLGDGVDSGLIVAAGIDRRRPQPEWSGALSLALSAAALAPARGAA